MSLQFAKATKKRSKARIALDGPSGAGKTYSALIAARVMAEGGKIAVIDTERGSASLYSDKFEFDVLELDTFSPQLYVNAIELAESAGYAVIVIDSLSHAWEGEGGALDMVDKAAKRSQSGNNFTAWKDVTPLQRKLVDTILQSRCHVIATMRSKMDYVQEKDERTQKTVIRKVGMAPIQRQGMEYEFTIVGDMDIDHNLAITKSRCDALADAVVNKPDDKFFKKLLDWLNDGAEAPARPAASIDPTPPPAAASLKPSAQPATPPPASTPAVTPPPANPAPTGPAAAPAAAFTRTAAAVKAEIDASAAKWLNRKISDGKKGLIAPMLEACFANGSAPAKRHQVQKFLTGFPSIREIPDHYLIALYTWLKPAQDSGGAWTPIAEAIRDAGIIIAHLDSQPDQIPLPTESQPAGDQPATEATPDPDDWKTLV